MRRILIIENDEDLLEEISEILINEGFDTVFSVNGDEGLKEIRMNHPDLILCDIMMPGMDGYEVLQKLHETGEEVIPPFIFITALSDRQFFRQGMELGAHDYLTKPFTREELLNAIRIRLDDSDRIERNIQQRLHILEKKLEARFEPSDEEKPDSAVPGASSFAKSKYSERKSELLEEVMRVIETNQMISGLRDSIRKQLQSGCTAREKDLFQQLEKQILSPNYYWDNLTIFQKEFNKRFPGFFTRLENTHGNLSRYDLVFMAATFLDLDTRQMAALLNISPDSVRKSRYRVKKKVGLTENDDFYHYVKSFIAFDNLSQAFGKNGP